MRFVVKPSCQFAPGTGFVVRVVLFISCNVVAVASSLAGIPQQPNGPAAPFVAYAHEHTGDSKRGRLLFFDSKGPGCTAVTELAAREARSDRTYPTWVASTGTRTS